MKERVQKLMAQANLGSRRACEEIIRQGRVRVNGSVIHLGDQADPYSDIIEVDGEKIAFPDRKVYIAFNKPKNVLSTDDPHDGDMRHTVRYYIPHEGHLFNIGRLDADSEGLMVLTNDGELANQLTHPRYRHSKTYRVVVRGLPGEEAIKQWERGIQLEEEDGSTFVTAPCSVKLQDGDKRESVLRIVMTEGKKRQIRRVASTLGYPVKSLVRTQIGKLMLGTLRPGEWRELTAKDLAALKTSSEELPTRRAKPAPRSPRRERTESDKPARRTPKEPARSRKPSSRRPSPKGKR